MIIGGISLYQSFAMYEEKKTFDVLKGTVPDFNSDIKLAITLDGNPADEIPPKEEGKNYNVKVECDKDATASWNYSKWQVEVKDFKKGTKCNVSFETTSIELPITPDASDFVIVPMEDLGTIKDSQILSHKELTYYSGSLTVANIDVSKYSHVYIHAWEANIGDGLALRISIDGSVKSNLIQNFTVLHKYFEYDVSNNSTITLSTYSSNGTSNPRGYVGWTIFAE